MSDSSPNGLELNPKKKLHWLQVARMNKWPLYLLAFFLLCLLGIMVYSVNFAHNPEEEKAKSQVVDIHETERPLIMGEGKGLALQAPAGPAIAQPSMSSATGRGREPLIVVKGDSEQANEYRQEVENLRRLKAQAYLTALSAPIVAKKASDSAAVNTVAADPAQGQKAGRANSGQLEVDASALRENGYDPAADKDKEAFFTRASKNSAWILPDTRTPGQKYEVKTGTVIPGVMVTGINSDLPGQIIAQVSQNVFDTATGRHLLVPQGAKLFGTYDARVVYGQERVLVAWNRLIYPDGSAVTLGTMPGADMSGNAGYTDEVNNHYFRIFGSAVLMSMITGGMSYSMDALNTSGNSGQGNSAPTLQDEMGAALASQLGQTTMQLLQKNLNIKPTLEIRPGYQFNLIVTKDVVFEKPYRSQR